MITSSLAAWNQHTHWQHLHGFLKSRPMQVIFCHIMTSLVFPMTYVEEKPNTEDN